MKCLRVYSTADGESHFDEVEIPTTPRQVHPNAAAFEVSAKYAAHAHSGGCATGRLAYSAGARADSEA